jgi:hypothetical protein
MKHIFSRDSLKAIDAVRQTFPFTVAIDDALWERSFLQECNNLFGDDGYLPGARADQMVLDTKTRWTWLDDTMYFKNEVDAVLFKMHFC